ncbi:BON domain-containing protein [Burkholderia sp. Bp9126]|nr:BON domain-containing protein [Burkholderia sp. Bp9126]
MQRRYLGRPTERRGPSNWQERNERAFWGGGERDTPNYDESLLPDDEYESAYRLASEYTGPEDWGSEWGDWADRASQDLGRRSYGGGRRGASSPEYGGERGYGEQRRAGEPGRRTEQGGYQDERSGLQGHQRMGRYGSYGDASYGGAMRQGGEQRGRSGAQDRPRFGESDAPRRRQGPKGYTRSDERIREDICERLAGALDIDVSDVSVQVSEGRVELDGTVPARWMKHCVEDIADSCMCVRDVENRVRVRRDDDEHPSTVLRPDHRTVTPTQNPLHEEPADTPPSVGLPRT